MAGAGSVIKWKGRHQIAGNEEVEMILEASHFTAQSCDGEQKIHG